MCIACGKWCWADEREAGPPYIVRGDRGNPIAIIQAGSFAQAIMKKQRMQVVWDSTCRGEIWTVELASADVVRRFMHRP
jgi:hypothetical protein